MFFEITLRNNCTKISTCQNKDFQESEEHGFDEMLPTRSKKLTTETRKKGQA